MEKVLFLMIQYSIGGIIEHTLKGWSKMEVIIYNRKYEVAGLQTHTFISKKLSLIIITCLS